TTTALGLDPELYDLYLASGAYGGNAEAVLRSLLRTQTSTGLLHTSAPGWRRTVKGTWVRLVRGPGEALRVLEELPRIAEWMAVFRQEVRDLGHDPDEVEQALRKGDLSGLPQEVQDAMERIILDMAYAAHQNPVPFSRHGA